MFIILNLTFAISAFVLLQKLTINKKLAQCIVAHRYSEYSSTRGQSLVALKIKGGYFSASGVRELHFAL